MLREVTWRSWAFLFVVLTAYVVCGLRFSHNGGVIEQWMAKIGECGGALSPFVLIGVYTATGKQWWRNDLGSALIQLAVGISLICTPLAYTFVVDNGELTPSFWAWTQVSGPIIVTLAILRLSLIFLRVHRDPTENSDNAEPG